MLQCKVFETLVKVLRLDDSDGQSMTSMYGEIIEAKKAILVAVDNSDKDYKAITTAMESKMNGRLDTPLHMAAYALNPYYSYATTSIFTDVEVMSGLMEVIDQFYLDDDEKQNKVLNIDLPKFKKKEVMFGNVAATKAISNANFNAGKLVPKIILSYCNSEFFGLMHNTLYFSLKCRGVVGNLWTTNSYIDAHGFEDTQLDHKFIRM